MVLRFFVILSMLCGILGLSTVGTQEVLGSGKVGIILPLEGSIGPVMADFIERGFEEAVDRGAGFIVLHINTPGGLLTSTRDILGTILNSSVPVIGYVGPQGAHAASAGTFILYATHIAAMAPGTNVGAAIPVQIGGEDGDEPSRSSEESDGSSEEDLESGDVPEDAMSIKVMSDAAALIRSLAEARGRDIEFAEEAVREGTSITASEALERNVINFMAEDVDGLLEQVHGEEVEIKGKRYVIDTEGVELVPIEEDWRTQFLMIITDPNIAFLLLMAGVYGLIFELSNFGLILPGVFGVVCLFLGLYSLTILPLNFTGLILLLLGIGFMVSEVFVGSFGLLALGGVVAFFLGATMLFDPREVSVVLDWWLVVGSTVFTLVVILGLMTYMVRSYRRPVSAGHEALLGMFATVESWDGGKGYIITAGERWYASGEEFLVSGQRVRITGVDGVKITVESVGRVPFT